MERVSFFIDGFNLYHALKDKRVQRYKWLDINALANTLLSQKTQQLQSVYYFSAYAKWVPEREQRHKIYIKALESTSVIPVMGRFKEKKASCRNCKSKWKTHEEKETDLNIGLYMLDQAYRNTYDTAFLVTGDSDMTAAVRMVKSNFPEKKIINVSPPGRRHSTELIEASDEHRKTKWSQVDRCIFPQTILIADGSQIHCPTKYQ